MGWAVTKQVKVLFEAGAAELLGTSIALISEAPPRGPFSKGARLALPFEEWVSARPANSAAALARILQALDDREHGNDGVLLVTAQTDGATLHPAFVARLTDSEAVSLGLPPATRLALNLKSVGLIQKDGFQIETSWTRGGGVPVMARSGAGTLRHDGRTWRIPEPL